MFFIGENRTFSSNETKFDIHRHSTLISDQNNDLFWLLIVGIFVAFALGWMICRHRYSTLEDSSHLVRCCPKSVGQKLRSICRKKKTSEQTIGFKSPTTSISHGENPKNDLPINESTEDFDYEMNEYSLNKSSNLLTTHSDDQRRRSSTSWPFQSPQLDFYSHHNGLKLNQLFFRT